MGSVKGGAGQRTMGLKLFIINKNKYFNKEKFDFLIFHGHKDLLAPIDKKLGPCICCSKDKLMTLIYLKLVNKILVFYKMSLDFLAWL